MSYYVGQEVMVSPPEDYQEKHWRGFISLVRFPLMDKKNGEPGGLIRVVKADSPYVDGNGYGDYSPSWLIPIQPRRTTTE